MSDTSLSTAGQDSWVLKLFADKLSKGYKGFFIEAGASDGGPGSNTLALERDHGWNGLLVEPNKKFFTMLTQRRTSVCRNVVLAPEDGKVDFIEAGYYGTAPEFVRDVFTSRGLELEKHPNYQQDFDGTAVKTTQLDGRSLTSLLDEIDAPEVIDYFSLDVEGGELSVFKGFPFDKRKIRALTMEARFYVDGVLYETDHRKPCRELLESKGYQFVGELDHDDAYIYPELFV